MKAKIEKALFAAALAVMSAAHAYAADAESMGGRSLSGSGATAGRDVYDFSLLDTDRDGNVSSSEFYGSGRFGANMFGEADANADGWVSDSEYRQWAYSERSVEGSQGLYDGDAPGIGTTGSSRSMGTSQDGMNGAFPNQ